MQRHLWAIVCLGLAVYSNAFSGPLLFDDRIFVVNNGAIKDLFDLKAIWLFWPARFVTIFSFALNYHIHQLQVFGYHFFNLIVHIGAALLVWRLVLLTMKTPWVALFAGLVFVAHPVQTQAVAFVSGRAACLGTFFYLAALLFYARSRLSQSRPYYACSLVAAALAMLSKEITMTLPAVLLLYEYYFLKTPDGINWKKTLPFWGMTAALLVLMVLTRSTDPSIEKTYFLRLVDCATAPNPWLYLLTEFRVLVTYIGLLLMPLSQNLDYDYRVSKSLFEPSTLASFTLLAGLAVTAFRLRLKFPLVSFGMAWFFVTLAPESSIMPLQDVINEYRLYLPMFGFTLVLTGVFYYGLAQKRPFWAKLVLTAIVAVYAALAYQRNFVWRDEVVSWSDVIAKSPANVRAYVNRGAIYHSRGDLDRAMADYNKAIELKPGSFEAYHNRATVYRYKGDFDRALRDYNKALELNPREPAIYSNRAILYQQKGDLDHALADYNEAIQMDPGNTDDYNNRAAIRVSKDDLDGALSDYNKAIGSNPNNVQAYNNRSMLYQKMGDLDLAIADYTRALKIAPNSPDVYNNRGRAYQAKGDFDRAIADYDKALSFDPAAAEIYNNRGWAHMHKKDFDSALADYNKAIALDPAYAKAYNNRGLLYREAGQFDLAIADLNKAIELLPTYAGAYNNRASVYVKEGDLDLARRDLDKAVKLDPANTAIYRNRDALNAKP